MPSPSQVRTATFRTDMTRWDLKAISVPVKTVIDEAEDQTPLLFINCSPAFNSPTDRIPIGSADRFTQLVDIFHTQLDNFSLNPGT